MVWEPKLMKMKENGRMGKQKVKEQTLGLMEEQRVGEFRNDRSWNITEYDKYGNIHGKYVNGEWIKN